MRSVSFFAIMGYIIYDLSIELISRFIVCIFASVSSHSLSISEEARMPPPAYKTNDPGKMFMQRKFTYRSLFPSGANQPIKPE